MCVRLKGPPWILKLGGLEISVQIRIFYTGKLKKIHFLFVYFFTYCGCFKSNFWGVVGRLYSFSLFFSFDIPVLMTF